MTVWLLPIEPFEERYTSDWLRWWVADLTRCGMDVRVVYGGDGYTERDGGEWLDPTQTWKWKGAQVAELASRWHEIQDGDVILSLDAWGPASTAALYMRQTTGTKVRIVGFWHAGAWDPHDYLARQGCGRWALPIEQGWARGLDLCLVGSEYSAQLIRAHVAPDARIAVVGCPVKYDELAKYATPWAMRERLVVFPHRLAPEKAPEDWELMKAQYVAQWGDDGTTWVRSRDVYTSKASLYELLGRARVVVSTALQETFGIVMQEGIALGAHPLAPRRLSYPETMRGQGALFDSVRDAAYLLRSLLDRHGPAHWDFYHDRAIERAVAALKHLGEA